MIGIAPISQRKKKNLKKYEYVKMYRFLAYSVFHFGK
jgi:hypothetical protein